MPESNTSSHSSLPLSAMESQKPSSNLHPLSFLSSFLHQHCSRLGSEISTRLDCAKRFAANAVTFRPKLHPAGSAPFASVLQDTWQPKHVFDIALSTEYVAKTMAGTPVYTVSNSNNEFVLISDPNGAKSLGLLCFRHEDAEALLAQVQLRQPVLGRGARVVPITLDQLKAADRTKGFDGVPVFQSDLLVVKKKNKRYCPIYFQKEDIERELSRVSKASRGGLSQHIMVGCLEDVLKKMEMNNKNSGWEDLIFIPPGKSYSQHIKEVAA
ncbi:protein TIC 22, chloroplastic isoform X2 [Magnolia sinica]|uniref:protein TIC 22, chloroplastic isoform X2 n=1 Tax=Magnolia sinica TaxID=86752 RepID=UPI00265948D0|nr:protein TIC 22, chloroplastic isoform X2 [Magnolia sinica]